MLGRIMRISLLCFNLCSILIQVSTWDMQYGYAVFSQLDFVFSFLLVVILVLRGIFGSVTLPYHHTLRIIYMSTFTIIAVLSFVRLVGIIFLYLCKNVDDDMKFVVLFYYLCELFTWSLQLALNILLLSDLNKTKISTAINI
jgi:hypothetical protein